MRTIVSIPTVVATIRWPCSQNRFPTIFGNTCPFESGQSDVAKPASLLVTSAPAIIKKNVAQATRIAYRFRPLLIYGFPMSDTLQLVDFFSDSLLRVDDKLKFVGHWFSCLSVCPALGNPLLA